MAKKSMPKEMYVVMEKDGDETFPIAYTSIDEIPESQSGESVGYYELKTAAKLRVTKLLVWPSTRISGGHRS